MINKRERENERELEGARNIQKIFGVFRQGERIESDYLLFFLKDKIL